MAIHSVSWAIAASSCSSASSAASDEPRSAADCAAAMPWRDAHTNSQCGVVSRRALCVDLCSDSDRKQLSRQQLREHKHGRKHTDKTAEPTT